MDVNDLSTIAKLLELSGPYGLVAFLWLTNTRTSRDLQAMHEQVVELAARQTEAIVKVELALLALKDAIKEWRE